MISTCFIMLWYYMTIMAWILYYLYSSFSYTLPWSSCNNSWNTESCQDGNMILNHTIYKNVTVDTNRTITITEAAPTTPSLEFWLHNVLGKSSSLEEVGQVQSHLAISLLIAWILTTLCIIKGVKSLGKVVYVTVLFPYLLLTILFVRAITLEGSIDGIIYCLHFNTDKLAEPQVWIDGTIHAFYSLGPVWGVIIVMASHNKFDQPTLRDTVTVCVVDTVSTLYAAVVVFSILGFIAKKEGIELDILASASGPGLAFVAYPTAVTLMPIPQLWAVLFFFMLLLMMLDSAFTLVEAVKTGIFDFLPARLKRYPTLVTLGFGACMFPLSLIFTTNCGVYLFQLFDWYATGFALLFGAFFEVTSLTLVYGVDRFSQDIMLMGGNQISKVVRFLYCVFIPVTTFVTFVIMLAQYGEPNYGDGYKYQRYAIALGILFGLVPIIVFFGVVVLQLLTKSGTLLQKFQKSLEPSNKWLPQDRNAAKVYMDKTYNYERTVLQRFKRNLSGSEDTPLF